MLLEAAHISKRFGSRPQVLADVSFGVEPGEFVSVIGPSGAGKTTLFRILNGTLPCDGGEVCIDGQPFSRARGRAKRAVQKRIGTIYQDFALVEPVSCRQNVLNACLPDMTLPAALLGLFSRAQITEAERLLARVGLADKCDEPVCSLSGGQKQRVAIAGALAMNPEILILDEASAMLDPRGRKGLMRVVRSLNDQGMTVVMITHFMEEAALADRVIVLDGGKIARVGTPEEVLIDVDALSALNLEVPFAAELSQALRRAGVPVIAAVTEEALAESVFSVFASHAAAASSAHENAAPQGSSGGKTLTEKASASPFAPKVSTAAGATDCAKFPASPAASTDGDVLIWLENVSFTYDAAEARRQRKAGKKPAPKQAKWGNSPEALWALDNVSLKVRKGEFLGIAGHTGSGKSTLIQHMNGILHPTSGRVVAFGSDIAEKGAANDVRGRVGVVFQYPENQLFAATVAEDVAFGPRNLGLSEEEVSKRVERSLRTVGLNPEEIAARSPFELSGGQQRRVAFAGVLAMEPEVLVLDEPAAGLDPKARKSFLDMVSHLHKEGLTVVMVSHNMDDLANLCDRVAVMSEGELLMEGTPAEVFTRAAELTSVGLATTSPEHFANLLREGGLPMPHEELATEDSIVSYLRGLL